MNANNLQAIYFDGNSYIHFPRFANFPKEELTVEFWVKKEKADSIVLEFVDDNLIQYSADLCFTFENNKLSVFICDVNIKTLYALDNNWHHVALVYRCFSNDAPVQIFVDGYCVEIENIKTDFSNLKFSGTVDIYVGRKQKDSLFKGYIRNLRIWNSARTEIEIRQKMSISLMEFEGYLVGMWNFSSFNEIESKLGVRMPQAFADEERNLTQAIKDFSDTSTANNQKTGKDAINNALKATISILKESTQQISDEDDKLRIKEIRTESVYPVIEVKNDTKKSDLTVENLETAVSNLKGSLIEVEKLLDAKTLLSQELDSLFSAEKDWFRFFINNESKTCIVNLSKSPADNFIVLDIQNIASHNVTIDKETFIQVGLRNLVPSEQIKVMKTLKIAGIYNEDNIDIDLSGINDIALSYCNAKVCTLPNNEEVLQISFNEEITLGKNQRIGLHLKNIYAGESTREGYIVVEAIKDKVGGITTILASQAIFGVFLLPFLGKLPLENGIVGRNELYYPGQDDASSDTINSVITFYFANPALMGLIPVSSLKDAKLVITTTVKLNFEVSSGNFPNTDQEQVLDPKPKWKNASANEQSKVEITEFEFQHNTDSEFLFDSMEILVIKATGKGNINYPEIIPISFEFKGFGGYSQNFFENFVRNMPVASNFRIFNNTTNNNVGIGVSNPLLHLAIGNQKVGLQVEANDDKKNEFESIKAKDVEKLTIDFNAAENEFLKKRKLISDEIAEKKIAFQELLTKTEEECAQTKLQFEEAQQTKLQIEQKIKELEKSLKRAEQTTPGLYGLFDKSAKLTSNEELKLKKLKEEKDNLQKEIGLRVPDYDWRSVDIFNLPSSFIAQFSEISDEFKSKIETLKEETFSQQSNYDKFNETSLNDEKIWRQAQTDEENIRISLRNATEELSRSEISLSDTQKVFEESKSKLESAKNDNTAFSKSIVEKEKTIALAKNTMNDAKVKLQEAQDRKTPKTELAMHANGIEKVRLSNNGVYVKDDIITQGNAIFESGLTVKPKLDVNKNVIGNAIDIIGDSKTTGTAQFESGLNVKGDINVGGKAFFKNGIDITGDSKTTGTAQFESVLNVKGGINAGGKAFFKNGIDITGDSKTTGTAQFDSGLNVNGEIHTNGNAQFYNGLSVNGNAQFNNGLSVNGKINVYPPLLIDKKNYDTPFVIIRYSDRGDYLNLKTDFTYKDWAAIIAGFNPKGGTLNTDMRGASLLKIFMEKNPDGFWHIIADVCSKENENWTVDVMYIRTGLVNDMR